MTWREVATRDVRFFEALAITLILVGVLAFGVVLGATFFRGLVTLQAQQLDDNAARRCVWWNPKARHP